MRPPPPDAAVIAKDAPVFLDASVAVAPAPPPPDPLAGKSKDEQWAWAVSLVPELSTYAKEPRWPELDGLGLKSGTITLYAPALEIGNLEKQLAACTPLPLKLDKESGQLVTRISPDGKRISPALKLKNYVELRVGVTFGDVKFEDGLEIVQADGGIPGQLSEVSKSGLRYDGASDPMHVICSKHVTKRQCLDGTTQVCELCEPTVVSQHQGMGSIGALVGGKPVECKPCPPDPVAPYQLAAIDHVLSEQPIMRVDKGNGPAFYTRQADCKKAALRKKPPTTIEE
jgi:hypothetical protein